jgi:Tfp pilus assembly protein PilO
MMRRGPVVAALAGVVLIALVLVGLILPKANAVKAKQRDVAQAKQEEISLQLQLQQLQADAEQAGALRKELKSLQAKIPPTADLPGLIRLINSAALKSAVDFISIGPGQPTQGVAGNVSIVPTQLTVIGGFWSLDQFLFRLETLPRAQRLLLLSISAGPEGANQLQISISTQFYTTDVSAGPGSVPGVTESLAPTTGSSTTTPTPGATSSPTTAPSPTSGG